MLGRGRGAARREGAQSTWWGLGEAAFRWVGWPEWGSGCWQGWGITQPLQRGSFSAWGAASPLLSLGRARLSPPSCCEYFPRHTVLGAAPVLPEEPRQHPCPSRHRAGPSAAQIGKTLVQSMAGIRPAQLSIPPRAVFCLQASESGARTRGEKAERCRGDLVSSWPDPEPHRGVNLDDIPGAGEATPS